MKFFCAFAAPVRCARAMVQYFKNNFVVYRKINFSRSGPVEIIVIGVSKAVSK
jgi:hypothetical protein